MLRRSFLAGVPVLVLSLLGCQPPPITSSYELSGIVSERFESGEMLSPLSGVLITFTSDSGLTFTTMTGADGRYRMQLESDTIFGQVRAELEGFQPSERTVYFDTPSRRVDLNLRPVVGGMP